jgi:hypothetical protein
MHTASTYADMTNTSKLRSSLRRLWSGKIDEVLGELFQNSQRARATCVAIITSTDGFTISDDGHGLLDGLDGFWRLLRIAESAFNNPTIEAQDPMGLGIHALLAHGQVHEVTFTSGHLALAIDPARWWNEPEYYTTWSQRVQIMPEAVSGLHIAVRCTPKLVEALVAALKPRDTYSRFRHLSPAQGYADLLRIDLNGQLVETRTPQWAVPQTVLLRTTYRGSPLTIGGHFDDYTNGGGHGVINWYGQIVEARRMRAFGYYLHVRDGRPVNPRSPSRQGMVEDGELLALESFVEDAIFTLLADPNHRHALQPAFIRAAYALNEGRARTLPYLVAAPLTGIDRSESSFDALEKHGQATIFTYDQALLLRGGLRVLTAERERYGSAAYAGEWKSSWEDLAYGLDSFIPTLHATGHTPHALICGDAARLRIADLHWRPGARRADEFNEPGAWGLSWTTNAEPPQWQPVTHAPVFAFTDPSARNPEDVDWAVGTNDVRSFLQEEVWYAFAPADDEDWEPQKDAYRDACNAWLRQLIGACVPHAFTYWDLQGHMADPSARIQSVVYHYDPPSHPASGQHRLAPNAITVTNIAGEQKRLQLLA